MLQLTGGMLVQVKKWHSPSQSHTHCCLYGEPSLDWAGGESQTIEGLRTTVSSLSSHGWHAAREDYTNSVLLSHTLLSVCDVSVVNECTTDNLVERIAKHNDS